MGARARVGGGTPGDGGEERRVGSAPVKLFGFAQPRSPAAALPRSPGSVFPSLVSVSL
jgi:hypothetical protein